jgi:hypothetical protein
MYGTMNIKKNPNKFIVRHIINILSFLRVSRAKCHGAVRQYNLGFSVMAIIRARHIKFREHINREHTYISCMQYCAYVNNYRYCGDERH